MEPLAKQSVAAAAFAGACPRCGARTLFAGPVKFAERCGECTLDFTQYNVGDGPAAFLTMIVGAAILGLALFVEFTWVPPMWLHVLLWVPLTMGAVAGSLRVAKAALLIAEHRNHANQDGA